MNLVKEETYYDVDYDERPSGVGLTIRYRHYCCDDDVLHLSIYA